MKKTILLTACCCLLALASCQKSGINLFRGSYSFKTSGEVSIQRQASLFDTIPPAAYTIALSNEIGQMEISTLDPQTDSVVVVLNYFEGDVVVTSGHCQENQIVLKDFNHITILPSIDGNINVSSTLRVHALGRIYDENTLILDMSYRGRVTVESLRYDISGDHITLVANRN